MRTFIILCLILGIASFAQAKQGGTGAKPPGSLHIQTKQLLPRNHRLYQMYPNPFSGSTTIRYELSRQELVTISIYNSSGRMVRTLVWTNQEAGIYRVEWNEKNEHGWDVADGVYFCRMIAGNFSATKRMFVIRSDNSPFRGETGSLHSEAKPAFPAYIRVLSKTFNEPSGNQALDAEEAGELVIEVRNEGLGKGKLSVRLTSLSPTEHLAFRRNTDVGEVAVDQSRTVRIPFRADLDVASMRREFRVELVEEYYEDTLPFTFSFDTKAFDPLEFRIILKSYDDSREIFKRNNPDGSIDAGELIQVIANVQNIGAGKAEEVKVTVEIEGEGGEVHYRSDLSGSEENQFDLGTMPSGADGDVLFYFFTNPMFSGKKVKINLVVWESRGRYETSKRLSFDIGQSVPTERSHWR